MASLAISAGTEKVLSRPTSATGAAAERPSSASGPSHSLVRVPSFSSVHSTPRHMSSHKVQQQWELIDRIEEQLESQQDILRLSQGYLQLSDLYISEDSNFKDALEMRGRAMQCVDASQVSPRYLENITRDMDRIRTASAEGSKRTASQQQQQQQQQADSDAFGGSFSMQADDDFGFDVPGLLEMTPIYAMDAKMAAGATNSAPEPSSSGSLMDTKQAEAESKGNDATVVSDGSSVSGAKIDAKLGRKFNSQIDAIEDAEADDSASAEEKEYQVIAQTGKNIGGLVGAANEIDLDVARGAGRVKKNEGFSQTASHRNTENMEFLFPTSALK